ncbi:sigma-70 family RNA polymerase sigma factor [Dyadobacter sp. CY261]|uniref:RNA polymerase sigma factor n=1 Tax=Dyadobacter sp. CY261 TaxID=2907203 RepID=UPI001F447F45|nr:sigma-70 family RNA polymerase sigma factor [Dyadobacter sp. CY261]MCF0070744.1 sigma-70 family RNA polymerase sigma factor [Dyadobacter sp. CY261]
MMNNFYATCSDENILALISEQDDELAFAELYNRYFKTLFNYAYSKVNDRFTAQEIVQELFVNVWQNRRQNHVECGRPFLFTIAKRLIISFFRKEYTRQHHYGQWEIHRSDSSDAADQPTLASDLQNRYEEGLHLLSSKCHDVFVLSRKGFSNKQIGEQLGISEKTVEQHITKALRILKAHLKEHMICALLLFPLF